MKYLKNNWSFKDMVKFLENYKFKLGHVQGSHYFFNGRIEGKDRIVQAINNKSEKKTQSENTMKLAVRHSGIKKEYFNEWKNGKTVHKEIIC